MLPVSLKIKGLYSYQTEQIINFENLLKSQLFGIFGKIGSGKTSILEAIRLSLYGQADKLTKKENFNYNLLNLKSNEMNIEFVFKVENFLYKTEVNLKRKRDFNKLGSLERRFYKKVSDTWEPLELNKLEEIIGINYKNFNRTIIIPQGKFQEFISLKPAEKTEMLKELFNLNKFDLYDDLKELLIEAENKKSEIEGHLNELKEVDEKILKELEELLKNIEKKILIIENDLKKLKKEESILNELRKKSEELNNARNELKKLEKKSNEIETLRKNIENYKICKSRFEDILNQRSELRKIVVNLKNNIKKDEKNAKKLNDLLFKKEENLKNLKKEYENLQVYRERIDKILMRKEILKQKKEHDKLTQVILKKEKILEQLETEKDKKQKQLNKLKEEMENLDNELSIEEELFKVKEWFNIFNNLKANLKDVEIEKRKIENELNRLNDKKREILKSNNIFEKDIQRFFDAQKEKLNKNEEEILLSLQEIKVREKLIEYSEKLKDGEPCPLCGSTVHPQKLKFEDLKDRKKEIEKKLKNVRELKETNEKIFRKLNNIEIMIAEKSKNYKNLDEKFDNLKMEIENNIKTFKFKNFTINDEKKVLEMLNYLKGKKKHRDKIKEDIKNFEKEISIFDNNIKKLLIDLSKQKEQLEGVKQKIDLLKSKLDEEYESYKNENECNLAINKLKDKIEFVEKNYKKEEKELENIKQELDQLNGKIISNKENLISFKKKFDELENEISERLKEENFETIHEIEEILSKKINIKSAEDKIKNYENKFNLIKKQIETLEEFLKEKSYNKDEHLKILENIEYLEKELKKLFSQKGENENRFSDIKAKIIKRKKLEKELKKIMVRVENLNILEKLFKGKKFVNYVSTIFLKDLVKRANERFIELTKKQLMLEIDENNNFIVIDFLNDGRKRHIKTLSGGQLFQASLSLALSLSDSIKSSNFFFLDEGFGTLDKEALSTVVETLRKLQKEGKIIGIISHVDELQEEIDDYLLVSFDSMTGSKIEEIHR